MIRKLLKYILPPPVKTFMREISCLKALIQDNKKIIDKNIELNYTAIKNQRKMIKEIQEVKNSIQVIQIANDSLKEDVIQITDKVNILISKNQHIKMIEEIQGIRKGTLQILRNTDELIWGEIFNNVIYNSQWLVNKSFSPGRWAVGYQYLYVVYRILNEIRPQKILELGLGQSTRLIGQYAAANETVSHIVVEHDPEWIYFFQRDFKLPINSKILQLERKYRTYREDDKVLSFVGFKEILQGKKFNFISIDAPLGGKAVIYARVDILDILPDCLSESFVIIIDDFDRMGEKNMHKILTDILKKSNISFYEGIYKGKKDCIIICSPDFKFLCSL